MSTYPLSNPYYSAPPAGAKNTRPIAPRQAILSQQFQAESPRGNTSVLNTFETATQPPKPLSNPWEQVKAKMKEPWFKWAMLGSTLVGAAAACVIKRKDIRYMYRGLVGYSKFTEQHLMNEVEDFIRVYGKKDASDFIVLLKHPEKTDGHYIFAYAHAEDLAKHAKNNRTIKIRAFSDEFLSYLGAESKKTLIEGSGILNLRKVYDQVIDKFFK